MERNFKTSLFEVLKHEGGWADHPKDPGGATMKGVTLSTFRRYVKPNATKEDLKNISDAQLQSVYKQHYWDAVRASELPDGVDYAVFDYAVNSGPVRAIKHLQRAVGEIEDGKIGPATLAAVKATSNKDIVNKLCDIRLAFLQGLRTWPTFGKGWNSRVSGVRKKALSMVGSVKPESKAVAFASTAGTAAGVDLVTVATDVVSNVERQQEAFTSGSIVRIVIGLIVLGGALVALYGRWSDAGKPKFWQ